MNDIAIEISVDTTHYRIELEQDVFGVQSITFAWDSKDKRATFRTLGFGSEPTRQEALNAAMALIDLGESEPTKASWLYV